MISNLDPSPRLRGRALVQKLLESQQRWIQECETNGRSYAGPNGDAIRRADQDELRRLENILK